jgi:hypothetical protein
MHARATGATDKEGRFEKLGSGRIGLGTGEVLCPAAGYKKARLWRAFF